MRFQGRITHWDDDRGFGFVAPFDGGDTVFVHINSFADRRRRPRGDEAVSFAIATDPAGRKQARNVAFVRRSYSYRDLFTLPSASSVVRIAAALAFLAIVAGLVYAERLSIYVLALYLGASVYAFAYYVRDKTAARNERWRIPEKSLHVMSLLGGWPGALVAQVLFRHKTTKASFRRIYWITVALNLTAFGLLLAVE